MCNLDTLFKRQGENTGKYGSIMDAERKMQNRLITSQSQNDYVGLEVGAKTEAIHFPGFAV